MQTFIFGFSAAEKSAIDDILKELKFAPSSVIEPGFGSATVRSIVEGKTKSEEVLHSTERLVLFHKFENQDINHFMNAYQTQVLPLPIWAAVTDTSIRWKFKDLLAELVEEREKMAHYMKSQGVE